MSKYVEIRHNGNFVARYEDIPGGKTAQQQAEEGAKAMFGADTEGVVVAPGRAFELHCKDGFITSFETQEAAAVHMEAMKKAHASHVERGGPATLKKGWPKGTPFPALRDEGDPGFEIKSA
jgi:hypothetical protein